MEFDECNIFLLLDKPLYFQTGPEFVQWSKDLVQAWCQAKRLLKKGPKLISMQRSVAEEANFNKVS